MFDIFISYRRGDSRADAGRVYDRLSHHFGPDCVFMDVDDIEPGQDFAGALRKALENCGALVVLVSPDWADFKDGQGRRRLEQPNDFVRLEVVTALDRGVTLLPVLVGGAAVTVLIERRRKTRFGRQFGPSQRCPLFRGGCATGDIA